MTIPMSTYGRLLLLLLAVVLVLACRAPPAAGADSEFEDGTSPKFPGCDNPFQKVRRVVAARFDVMTSPMTIGARV